MKNGSSRFTPSEIVTLIYIFITTLLICFSWGKLDNAVTLLVTRIAIVAVIYTLNLTYKYYQNGFIWFVRNAGLIALTTYWYPETYYLGKCILPNLDHIFVAADQWLFGCQPSIEFSQIIPYAWFSELMNISYLSYFIMIMGTAFYFFFTNRIIAQKVAFVILNSFLIYYIIFIILPVMGPQFYFPYPENSIPESGIFRHLMIMVQEMGEQPTGAFPSSHVGICLINLMLLFKYARKRFYLLLPLAILLICSTVYIKAHYLIDVIAGFITAPIVYWFSLVCWKKFERSNTLIERIS
ncbi:MAG: phosphatase PAP2 family protein [Prevotellaceae bacterium]|jgi:membrane-associated phospholipid phosphatase|nr:phosphatase PAP2 family protein [Prevotellaceae bacterium]